MVNKLFLQNDIAVEGAKGILSVAEQLTVVGILTLIVVALLLYIRYLVKEHKKEISELNDELKELRIEFKEEFKRNTETALNAAKNYEVLSNKLIDGNKFSSSAVMEKLNDIIRKLDVQTSKK